MLTEYLWRIGGDLGGLGVVAGSKQVVELACKELFSSGQVVADGQAKSQIWILEHVRDVRDDVLLFHADRQHLCFRGEKVKNAAVKYTGDQTQGQTFFFWSEPPPPPKKQNYISFQNYVFASS